MDTVKARIGEAEPVGYAPTSLRTAVSEYLSSNHKIKVLTAELRWQRQLNRDSLRYLEDTAEFAHEFIDWKQTGI